MTDEIKTEIALIKERQQAQKDNLARIHRELKEDIGKQAGRIDKQDGNIRFVVLAVISSVIAGVMNIIMRGGAP